MYQAVIFKMIWIFQTQLLWPALLLTIFWLGIMLCPFKILYYRMRWQIVLALGQIVIAPFG